MKDSLTIIAGSLIAAAAAVFLAGCCICPQTNDDATAAGVAEAEPAVQREAVEAPGKQCYRGADQAWVPCEL